MDELPDAVRRYFAAIHARDADAIGALFTTDAQLHNAAGTFTGPAQIAAFYRDLAFAIPGLRPEVGNSLVVGDRAAVEIQVHSDNGPTAAADFFTLQGEHISGLTIYTMDHQFG